MPDAPVYPMEFVSPRCVNCGWTRAMHTLSRTCDEFVDDAPITKVTPLKVVVYPRRDEEYR